jgi:hypothetical protein
MGGSCKKEGQKSLWCVEVAENRWKNEANDLRLGVIAPVD